MSSKHKKILFVVSILALMVAGATGLYFFTHEKVEKEVREPPSGEARHNRYLALERLLQRFDHSTQTLRTLSVPEEALTTIILADSSYAFSPEQVDAWVEWVHAGGHVVLAQPLDGDEKTAPLLSRLGFSPVAEGSENAWPEDVDVLTVSLDEEAVAQEGLWWDAADADWLARHGDASAFAASRSAGMGRVTLIGDPTIFGNDMIGKAEHATLAVRVVALVADYAAEWPNVTIVQYGERQSWMFYVLGHTWPFVVIVLVTLLLAIRAGGNRFGPTLADPPSERRSRREHVDAVGRFLWHQGSVAALVEATQRALLDELEHRRPSLGHVGLADRNQIVADELGISYNEVRDLLRTPSGNRDAQSFTEQIRQLEEFRRKL